MKVLIFISDGVGLRNFAFTDFYRLGKSNDFDIVYWNNTLFPLKDKFGYNELKINDAKPNFLTDIFKRVRKEIELSQNYKTFKNEAYLTYKFPNSYKTLKNSIKNGLVTILSKVYNSQKGLTNVRNIINKLERKTGYYNSLKTQLIQEKPDFIFCTNQRALVAISVILAAKELKIPTATFIFSWDNLPKATMVVEADYYFVWSEYMKNELIKYYSYINKSQIKVVGTPQFEPHFNKNLQVSKKDFFDNFKLDFQKKYICFSGDDITTSPYDQYYLKDVAEAVCELNSKGHNFGIIFRKCPVDISNRFENVLIEFSDIIVPINPNWEIYGEQWNAIMPTPNDFNLLVNTVSHTEAVINIGSSMVFDYACHNKPCLFINYNHKKVIAKKWDINIIYKYIHFESMPSKKSVLWINNKESLAENILMALRQPDETVKNAIDWFKIINIANTDQASENIWKSIKEIMQCK